MEASDLRRAERALSVHRRRLLALYHEHTHAQRELGETLEPDREDVAADAETATRLAGLSALELSRLRAIDQALERLRDGSYATCMACRRLIARARLRAAPETPYCHACAEAREAFSLR